MAHIPTKEEACETAEKIGAKVREWCDDAGVELRDVKDVLEKKINDKPLQSSLVALGVGLLFGLLISRN